MKSLFYVEISESETPVSHPVLQDGHRLILELGGSGQIILSRRIFDEISGHDAWRRTEKMET